MLDTNVSHAIVSGVQIVIIVIAIVLTLGLITCIISHYKMGARSWSERRSRPPPHTPGSQHNHPSPQTHIVPHNTNSVLYNPAAVQERQRLEAAAHRDRQVRLQSVQTDLALDLPPSIPLPDGEEHPYNNIKSLHLRSPEQESEIYRGCIRPPPNRTILEGESPPPYRSNSMGLIHKPLTPPRLIRTADGYPLVMRSQSLSVNNRSGFPKGGRLFPLPQPTHLGHALRITCPSRVPCSSSSSDSLSSGNSGSFVTPGCEFNHVEPPPPYSAVVSRDLCSILDKPPDGGGF